MDRKDLRQPAANFIKEKNFKSQLKKMLLERTSRPRAKENIINPNMKGI